MNDDGWQRKRAQLRGIFLLLVQQFGDDSVFATCTWDFYIPMYKPSREVVSSLRRMGGFGTCIHRSPITPSQVAVSCKPSRNTSSCKQRWCAAKYNFFFVQGIPDFPCIRKPVFVCYRHYTYLTCCTGGGKTGVGYALCRLPRVTADVRCFHCKHWANSGRKKIV